MKDVNEQREAMGLDPFPVHHDAYIACDESELGE